MAAEDDAVTHAHGNLGVFQDQVDRPRHQRQDVSIVVAVEVWGPIRTGHGRDGQYADQGAAGGWSDLCVIGPDTVLVHSAGHGWLAPDFMDPEPRNWVEDGDIVGVPLHGRAAVVGEARDDSATRLKHDEPFLDDVPPARVG
jgi:hypothetical protein